VTEERKTQESQTTRRSVPLEQFLTNCLARGVSATVTPVMGRSGRVEFYIRPDGVDGDTLDFSVNGDAVEKLERAAGG